MQEKRETAYAYDKAEATSSIRGQLLALDEEQATRLHGIICSYVQSMGLACGSDIAPVAQEVVQEAIVVALEHAERFDPSRQVVAWLLGIALNIIKHKKSEAAKRRGRERSFDQIIEQHTASMSEHDLLNLLKASSQADPAEAVVSDEQVNALLSLVPLDDQQVLRLAFLEDFTREALAQRLDITSGAARVRLHRALIRLRAAWIAQRAKEQREDAHE